MALNGFLCADVPLRNYSLTCGMIAGCQYRNDHDVATRHGSLDIKQYGRDVANIHLDWSGFYLRDVINWSAVWSC